MKTFVQDKLKNREELRDRLLKDEIKSNELRLLQQKFICKSDSFLQETGKISRGKGAFLAEFMPPPGDVPFRPKVLKSLVRTPIRSTNVLKK